MTSILKKVPAQQCTRPNRPLKNTMAEPILTTKTQRHQEKLTKFPVTHLHSLVPWCLGALVPWWLSFRISSLYYRRSMAQQQPANRPERRLSRYDRWIHWLRRTTFSANQACHSIIGAGRFSSNRLDIHPNENARDPGQRLPLIVQPGLWHRSPAISFTATSCPVAFQCPKPSRIQAKP
jgi:hypothetical protein